MIFQRKSQQSPIVSELVSLPLNNENTSSPYNTFSACASSYASVSYNDGVPCSLYKNRSSPLDYRKDKKSSPIKAASASPLWNSPRVRFQGAPIQIPQSYAAALKRSSQSENVRTPKSTTNPFEYKTNLNQRVRSNAHKQIDGSATNSYTATYSLLSDEPLSKTYLGVYDLPFCTYSPLAVPILPWLYLGSKYDAQNAAFLQGHKIKFILNVSRRKDLFHARAMQDREDPFEIYQMKKSSDSFSFLSTNLIEFKFIPMRDSIEENLLDKYEAAFPFIDRANESDENILIHCSHGVSRSVAIVIAYLIREQGFTFERAFSLIKTKRSIANPNLGFISQLQQLSKI